MGYVDLGGVINIDQESAASETVFSKLSRMGISINVLLTIS